MPPPPAADRNLLFGILALQMDFVSRDALIAAMHAWVLDKIKPLARIIQCYFQQRPVKDHNTLGHDDLCRSFTAGRQKQTVPDGACCKQ